MVKERIEALRKLMADNGIQAYLIPSTDPHQSEYVPALWERRRWLSGFTGSAGDVAVTMNKAGLWTDSRYFLQAEQELKDSGIALMKIGMPETPSMNAWLKAELKAGDHVGFDPRLFSYQSIREMKGYLGEWKIGLRSIEENLVDAIWTDQPDMPLEPIVPHDDQYAGESVTGKLKQLRAKMAEEGVKAHVVTMLDAIAWLFNIRCTDVEYNPVAIAYAIITDEEAMLFTKEEKVTFDVKNHLHGKVETLGYGDFKRELQKLADARLKVWLDSGSVSQWVVDILEGSCDLLFKASPITHFKAIKNKTEIAGMRAAHIRDGAAMVKFLHWMERTVPGGGVTELSAAAKVEEFRGESELYRGPSFETIAGYGEHGAIVHYSSSPDTDVELKPEGIFLFDSGGQYLDGTTDITRTVALGEPDAEQKDRFTRVLKGHIQLTLTRFPQGTAGNQLDTIARKPLWDIGLNYGHGTGHGIGFFLNVHEGPQAISYYRGIGVPMEPGMIVSNEPGFYKAGEYGIRTENLILTREDRKHSGGDQKFYTFENLTYCPIDLRLVEKSMLTAEELKWLNDYHSEVYEKLSPYLKGETLQWLKEATRAI